MPRLRKSWNNSHRNMLNCIGPSMEPCRTLKKVSDYELSVPFNFTPFRLVKYECNSFTEGLLSLAIKNL